MASQLGLECVTIGSLARATGMSKSGLFAHFQSKENLQMAILQHAAENFVDQVVVPALRAPAGIARVRDLVKRWIDWGDAFTGGCIFVSAGTEFSDRPGKVRDLLLRQQQEWVDCLSRIAESAIRADTFRDDIDCEQFAFDLYSMLLGFHYYYKLLDDPASRKYQEMALDRMLTHYCRDDAKDGSACKYSA